jgi:hypothetical protein
MVEWLPKIVNHTIWFLSKCDRHLVSINVLEYAAIIIGLAGSILVCKSLLIDCCPVHPTVLLWTDNTTAKSWTKCIVGLSEPQGRALAGLFTHLLMFLGSSMKAAYIKGEKNTIVDYLSHLHQQDNFSQFCYTSLVAEKLPLFSPECRAALAGLHFTVDRVSEHSYSEINAWRDASSVRWYSDNFCRSHKIVDPYLLDINNYQEANLLCACFAVFLTLGHTLLCKTTKSGMIDNYLHATANDIK